MSEQVIQDFDKYFEGLLEMFPPDEDEKKPLQRAATEIPLTLADNEGFLPRKVCSVNVPSVEEARTEHSVTLKTTEASNDLTLQADPSRLPSPAKVLLTIPAKRKCEDMVEVSSTVSKKLRGTYLNSPEPGTTWGDFKIDGIDSGKMIKKINYSTGNTQNSKHFPGPQFVCTSPGCNMTTKTSGDMRKHWQTSRHSQGAKYQCHPLKGDAAKCTCSKPSRFMQVYALKRHLATTKVIASRSPAFDATPYMI
ncbi:hypothetical protein JR316_0006316 [Psilocybe cubensis]|uniref:Uncharacterized protein n=2 Tax=Psilocybe cubensis TaxID=181762 RepID=A0ACB8H3K1_PSICU|nr:hypothetical protein JR316_0006316 [Psilocybe cubensis]KAH9481789.1 hypothetical protein JR316_0006316 [Psilocybe cubensis]